jgi:hypothetical protein
MNDFQFFDTVHEIFLKPTPSKIVNSIFSRASTIQNMLTRHFLFQNSIQNFSDFASKQSSNNGNIFISTASTGVSTSNTTIIQEKKIANVDSEKIHEVKEEKSVSSVQNNLDTANSGIIVSFFLK